MRTPTNTCIQVHRASHCVCLVCFHPLLGPLPLVHGSQISTADTIMVGCKSGADYRQGLKNLWIQLSSSMEQGWAGPIYGQYLSWLI